MKGVHPSRRKDCGSSKSVPKRAHDDVDEDVGGDSGEEVDAAPKVVKVHCICFLHLLFFLYFLGLFFYA